MNDFLRLFGYAFVALALFFLLGLLNPFARRFYPESPGVVRRAAAPVLFALLAIACFKGFGLDALLALVAIGIVQIATSRRNRRRREGVKA